MYIQLMHRHLGDSEFVKHAEISCDFSEVFTSEGSVNEDLLLNKIPEGWLPDKVEEILLAVGNKYGLTGLTHLNKFKSWSKYFSA